MLLFGAGAAAHLQGRSKDAAGALERALEFNPRLTGASLLLGQIVYTDGNVTQAITIYEKALKHAPNDADLTKRLESWRADAGRSSGFRGAPVRSVQGDVPGARRRAAGRTGNRDAQRRRSGGLDRRSVHIRRIPSSCCFIRKHSSATSHRRRSGPAVSTMVASAYPRPGAARTPQAFDRVLTHELTHAMIANMAPRGIPSWLHEGLAQYFEGDDPGAARRRLKAAGRTISLRDSRGQLQPAQR